MFILFVGTSFIAFGQEKLNTPKAILNDLINAEIPDYNFVYKGVLPPDSLVFWAERKGTPAELAMAYFVAYMQASENGDVSIYERLVKGNALWLNHRDLKLTPQVIGLSSLSVLYQRVDRNAERLEVTLRLCEVREQLGENFDCTSLGTVYYDLKQYSRALNIYLLDAQGNLDRNNPFEAASIYNNIGGVYEKLHKRDSANWAYEQSLKLLEDSIGAMTVTYPEYYVYFRDIVKWNWRINSGNGTPVELSKITQRIINFANQKGEFHWSVNGYLFFYKQAYNESQYELATSYCDSALMAANKGGMFSKIPVIQEQKAKILLLKGEKPEAEQLYTNADRLKDSLSIESSEFQAIVASAFYESQEKEIEAREMTEKALEAEVQIGIERAKTLTFMLTSVVVGLLLLGLIYFSLRMFRSRKSMAVQKSEAERSLTEKELLLKEIHHRVKNNLQTISSLLELQASRQGDSAAVEALSEGQRRVRSIALIHQLLYQNETLAEVPFQEFSNKLFTEVWSAMKPDETTISLKCTGEPIAFDIDTAVPLGLILNELFTNTFKYGLSSSGKNEVLLKILSDGDGNFELFYKDSGPGLPENFEINKARSLGLRLINSLARQLGGKLSYNTADDSHFHIVFKDSEARKLSD